MALTTRLTKIWQSRKNAFINQFNGNSFIISTIKRIERELSYIDLQVCEMPFIVGFHREATYLPLSDHARLACLYVAKAGAKEISPCHLFFPILEGTDAPNYQGHVKPVMMELGWVI